MKAEIEHPDTQGKGTAMLNTVRKISACMVALGLCVALAVAPTAASAQVGPTRDEALAAMKKAAAFMMDQASRRGGFVWSYLPDLSRRWGEMEATPSIIWMQNSSTSTMGHTFLDAYHATGDDYFYRCAVRVARTLIRAQNVSGGWHYNYDFKGEASLKEWYATTAAQGWRLEEFLHYYPNATFDDRVTSEAATFLLRMYLERREIEFRQPLFKAIRFIVKSQYPNGGWPQRFPLVDPDEFKYKNTKPGYTNFITLNDGVAQENVEFLVGVYQTLGYKWVLPTIHKGMELFPKLIGTGMHPAFSLQYAIDPDPSGRSPNAATGAYDIWASGARTYEADGWATHTTYAGLYNLLTFAQIDPERRDTYLARFDQSVAWLQDRALPADYPEKPANMTHCTFVDFESNDCLFVHRVGSNIVNGAYVIDKNPAGYVRHYGIWRNLNPTTLINRRNTIMGKTVQQLKTESPLYADGLVLPLYYSFTDPEIESISGGNGLPSTPVSAATASTAVSTLTAEGYWLSNLAEVSNPYKGPGPATKPAGTEDPLTNPYTITYVGDEYDTSPYPPPADAPVQGITVKNFITRFGNLMQWIAQLDTP